MRMQVTKFMLQSTVFILVKHFKVITDYGKQLTAVVYKVVYGIAYIYFLPCFKL